jgi:hypothetical protein
MVKSALVLSGVAIEGNISGSVPAQAVVPACPDALTLPSTAEPQKNSAATDQRLPDSAVQNRSRHCPGLGRTLLKERQLLSLLTDPVIGFLDLPGQSRLLCLLFRQPVTGLE